MDVCVFFLHKSQYVSTSNSCMSIHVHFFVCEFLHVKIAKTLSNMHTATGYMFWLFFIKLRYV